MERAEGELGELGELGEQKDGAEGRSGRAGGVGFGGARAREGCAVGWPKCMLGCETA